jgi:hypothetical protein
MLVHRVPALKGRPKFRRPLRGQIQSADESAHSKKERVVRISAFALQVRFRGLDAHS